MFEAHLGPITDHESLRRRAIDYFQEYVRTNAAVPHTFAALNSAADPGPISPEQKLLRLESLAEPLSKTGVSFNDFADAHSKSDPASRALVDHVLDQWNHRPDIRRNPVSFAAFKEQLLDELSEPDWPEKLRDRLGLAHFDCVAGDIPVGLMEYEVGEVERQAESTTGLHHRFCAPTSLDGAPYAQFAPTPIQLPFGCPMALYVVQSDDDLVAELLHPRLMYVRSHLKRVGVISNRVAPADFIALRNNYLWALRLASMRDEFGAEV